MANAGQSEQRLACLLPELTNAFLASVKHDEAAIPYAFYGHSLGALISFELARALRSIAVPRPLALFVSGRRAPRCPLRGTPLFDREESDLLDELKRMGGMPFSLLSSAKWRAYFIPTLRADLRLSDLYAYSGAPLDIPIFAFRGEDDPIVTDDELAAWRQETTEATVIRTLTGAHFFDGAGIAALQAHIVTDLALLCGGALNTLADWKRKTQLSEASINRRIGSSLG